jgi:hypothetical protein
LFGFNPEISSNNVDVRLVNGHDRVAAAIRGSSAVNLLLYLGCQYLKRFDSMVMSREIAPEVLILRLFGGSQLSDLHQIRNHAFSILLQACRRKRFAVLPASRSTAHFSDTIHFSRRALPDRTRYPKHLREIRAREESDHGRNHPTDHRFLGRLRPAVSKGEAPGKWSIRSEAGERPGATPRFGRSDFVQASLKNCGLAAGTSKQFFSRTREVANRAPDANRRKALEDLLASQDKITAELAKGDPEALGDLLVLFEKTRQAAGSIAR